MTRLRMTAPLDRDGVSPDSIRAANEFLTKLLEERAETAGVVLDWNTWKCRVVSKRSGDLELIQWVRVIAP